MDHEIKAHFEVKASAIEGKMTAKPAPTEVEMIRAHEDTIVRAMAVAIASTPMCGDRATNAAREMFNAIIAMHDHIARIHIEAMEKRRTDELKAYAAQLDAGAHRPANTILTTDSGAVIDGVGMVTIPHPISDGEVSEDMNAASVETVPAPPEVIVELERQEAFAAAERAAQLEVIAADHAKASPLDDAEQQKALAGKKVKNPTPGAGKISKLDK